MSTHLTDLFKVGEEVTISIPQKDGDPLDVVVYMRKPTIGQQQEAREKARAAQYRRKREFKDQDSPAYLSLAEEIDSYEDKDALLGAVARFEESRLRTQAYNDTLFAEDYGSDWGEDGEKLVSLLDAISKRWDEIDRHNKLVEEDGELDSKIAPGEDAELKELRAEQAVFEDEVEDRFNHLFEAEKAKHRGNTADKLRAMLVKKAIDLEGDAAWYQEYRVNMLWNAARDPEDRKKRYFSHPDDILEMPNWVQTQLFNALDALDRVDSKNSVSPQLSSV